MTIKNENVEKLFQLITFFKILFSRQNDNRRLRSLTDLPQPFPRFSNGEAASNAGASIVWDVLMKVSVNTFVCSHGSVTETRHIEISWLCVIKVASSSCVHHWKLGRFSFFSFFFELLFKFFVGLCCKLPPRSNLQVSIGLYVFKYSCPSLLV